MVLLVFGFLTGLAADTSSIRFIVSPSLLSGNLQITFYDGLTENRIDLRETKEWRGPLYAPYCLMGISIVNADTAVVYKKLFVKKGSSQLHLTDADGAGTNFRIDMKSSKNIVGYEALGGKQFDNYTKEISDRVLRFIKDNRYQLGIDSIYKRASSLRDSLYEMELAFIRKFPDNYIAYWTFQSRVLKTDQLSADSLLYYYTTVLSDKYKNTEEGQYLLASIRSKIGTRVGGVFPAFDMTDLASTRFTSSELRGNYVLVHFWASWCVPCIQEIPTLNKLQEKYRNTNFKIIGISIDTDSLAFRQAIQKHTVTWPQVYGDMNLYYKMAYYPIPQVYLIDKDGHTIYNRTLDKDPHLVLLTSLLAERLP